MSLTASPRPPRSTSSWGTLSVFRHEPQGFLNVLSAERHEVVSARPFEVVEVRVAELLGDDPR